MMENEPDPSIDTKELEEELQLWIANEAFGSEFTRLAVSGAMQDIEKARATEIETIGSDEGLAEKR